MKKLTLLLLAIFTFACSDADLADQGPELETKAVIDEENKAVASNEIFNVVEEQASFPGGMQAWSEHLKSTIKYPDQAKKLGIEGRVFLSFIVNEDGSLDNIQVVQGIGAGCDEEAVNALLESPNWVAGKQRGIKVKSKMQLRIEFKLDESAS